MIHHLRAAGVSLVLDSRGTSAPTIAHWGRDLGALSVTDLAALVDAQVPAVPPSSIDVPLRLTAVPTVFDGWTGQPAVAVAGATAPARHVRTVREDAGDGSEDAGGILAAELRLGGATVSIRWELTPQGVLVVTPRVRNDTAAPLTVLACGVALPVPDRARELLDFTGRWAGERTPQRLTPGHGTWLRETRHGRGGHDAPFLLAVGTRGFDFGAGEVWAAHVAWSGDVRQWFERTDLGPSVLGAGERIEPVVLAPGEVLEAASVVAVWSDAGLDGVSDRVHPWVRSWSTITTPRPLTLNTWEAVYFDQSLERLEPLVAAAADVGVERFVLDDGWFRGRSDDRRALGDWEVDRHRWPDGLGALIDRVTSAGMQFGLWVEPEMVSLDSELARQHPDWLLTAPDAVTWRHQHVLDLARPDVSAYLFERLDALLAGHAISYLKWDHNRDLLVADTRRQTLALYALLDRLRAAHPHVEIESCASGGGRVDLGILRRVDRVWPSDANDPLVRQAMQRWTGILLPPEYLGSHVGDERAHTTGRTSRLSFRLTTALFGHAGIESDLTRLPAADRAALAVWTAAYRSLRPLLHSGRVVHLDSDDPAVTAQGVVATDAASAVFSYAVTDRTQAALPAPLRLAGLDDARRYRVRIVDVGAPPRSIQDAPPVWVGEGTTLPGAVLAETGLAMPALAAGEAVVVRADAV